MNDYTGIKFRLQNLDKWAVQRGIEDATKNIEGIEIRYRRQPPVFAGLANGATVAIADEVEQVTVSITDAHIRKCAWVQVTNLPAGDIDSILTSVLAPVASLVELCMGIECEPVQISVERPGSGWIQISAGFFSSAEDADDYSDQLANFDDIGPSGLAAWIDKSASLSPLPAAVARLSTEGDSVHLETHLLELTTIAEGIHDSLCPNSRSIPDDEADRIKKRIKDLIVDEKEYGPIVNGSLSHLGVLGYAKRLMALVDSLGSAAPKYVGNRSKWSRQVEEIRVGFAHRKIKHLDTERIDQLFVILLSLQWLLTAILLAEAGMSPETIESRICKLGSFRNFLSDAREAFPTVYGEVQA